VVFSCRPDAAEVKGRFVQIEDFLKVLKTWIADPKRKTTVFTAWVVGMPIGVDVTSTFVRRLW
jgi:hypothetical protein